MSVSARHSLEVILQCEKLFIRIVRHIDKSKAYGGGLAGGVYREELGKTLITFKDPDRTRIATALDEDNLLKAGLLLDHHKLSDTIIFQPWLVEMMRHFDESLFKELSDKELDELRGRLSSLVDTMEGDADYASKNDQAMHDVETVVFNVLNEVNSRLDQNVKALTRRAERLSEILDSDEWQTLESNVMRRDTLKEVHELYNRYIQPALMFLDAEQIYPLNSPRNPIKSITRVLERFNSKGIGKFDLAIRVGRLKKSILDKHHPIRKASRTLDRYIKQDAHEHRMYQGVEAQFNALVDAAKEKHNLAISQKYTRIDHPAHDCATIFSGIKTITRKSTLIKWGSGDDNSISSIIAEDVRVYRNTLKAINKTVVITDNENKMESHEGKENKRVKEILLCLRCFEPIYNVYVHGQIHDHLASNLDGYMLPDLVTGLSIISSKYTMRPKLKMSQINYKNHTLNHMEREIIND
jgi:hypothetical protein